MPIKSKDIKLTGEYIIDEYERRKKKRHDQEQAWKEIDRQVAMIPDTSHKLDANGNPDPKKRWMPETELPLQAECLEVLTADARRMLFPDSGSWLEGHACLTDAYIALMEGESIIAGDENEVPSLITQDNVDKICQGVQSHWSRQYDLYGNMDIINAESFSYGMGLGRGRIVTKKVFLDTAKGIVTENQKIPVLFPTSIKNNYLDDRSFSIMGEGHILGPCHISARKQLLEDARLATRGNNDPYDMNGGWIANSLKGMKGDKNGEIEIIEMEGDIVVPKSQGAIVSPGTIISVAKGETQKVIRIRFTKLPFTSYIQFPYHVEGLSSAYPTSPLMKGWPIQKAAVDALNRLMMAAALNTQPPIRYDKDDQDFALSGGPNVFPGVLWRTLSPVEAIQIGNPSEMQAIYLALLSQYSDVTGINAPRLGAQTVSHTTAYSKQVELNRGTVRTVDYVRNTLQGPLEQWLNMAWQLGRSTWNKTQKVYIEPYNGFVELDKKHLPEDVTWKALGSGGPDETKVKSDRKVQAAISALQIEQFNLQQGRPNLDPAKIQEAILREAGWTDTDVLKVSSQPTNIQPAAAPAAVQALAMNNAQ